MRQSIRLDILPVVCGVIVLACVFHACALNIPACGNLQDEYINNTDINCNYKIIYCYGDQSQYCDAINMCDINYDCPAFDPSASTTIGTTVSQPTGSTTYTTGVSPEDVRAVCKRGITEKYRYAGNSNYYYYCIEGFLIVEQCPMGFVFSEQTRACSRQTVHHT
ncbi:hypothetical protein KR044_005626 [Drosophila immigrans]|nr:hypothetical protein KR044_005626 [Drosophila immigrans]